MEEAPAAVADPRGALDRDIARGRADAQSAVVLADVVEVSDAVDVDEDGGTSESKAHGRNQALTASQDPRIRAMLLQLCERLVSRVSADVIEGCRYHQRTSFASSPVVSDTLFRLAPRPARQKPSYYPVQPTDVSESCQTGQHADDQRGC